MKTTTASLVLVASALAGCSQGTASRPEIGQTELLPALDRAPRGLAPASGPSVTGADRSHWQTITVTVAPDGSRGWIWPVHAQPRHGGAHPTALSSLETGEGDSIFQLFGAHARDAGGALVAPLRLFHRTHEHAGAYERDSFGAWRDGEAR